jgi:DNA invertase Pin-like site-specific DNA recombinase
LLFGNVGLQVHLNPRRNSVAKTALYARYSCDQQRDTSIEDQLRRCRDVAKRQGIAIEDALVFTDAALSGTAKHTEKREGYRALLDAWDNGKIDVILVDDFSRLSRDAVEQAHLVRRLESNRRVRLLTANGVDTEQKNWQLQVGLLGVVGQQAIRDTQHLVVRGMLGQLERGYMIAAPAFGYALDRMFDTAGNRIGTHWKIHESNAVIVLEIFERRGAGQSMHQIARWLNDKNVPTQRKAKTPEGGYWRAARVRSLLANTVYRGEFTWNGSAKTRAEAKKTGRELDVRVFSRPQLRIVSDELWYRCNENRISRSGYGGGKHVFAGLIKCGCCGSVLVLSSQGRCRSVYCANCTSAKSMAGKTERQTSTVAVAGVQTLLIEAMRNFLTPKFVEYYRGRLRDMLTGDQRQEIEQLEDEVAKLNRTQIRLSHLLANAGEDDPVLQARYEETRVFSRQAEAKLKALIEGHAVVDDETVEAQLRIDPADILEGLFDANVPPEKLRSVLARLFADITLEGKDGRYTSFFRINFAPGEALAMLSGTDMVISETVSQRYRLKYTPDYRSTDRLPLWSVTSVKMDEGGEILMADSPMKDVKARLNGSCFFS